MQLRRETGYNGSVKNTTVNGGYDHETEKAPCPRPCGRGADGVPELTSTIQPKFTPDWFQKNEERGIYLDPALSIGSGQTLGGFLENSLKDYVRQSNFVAFLAFDSTGMSAGEQAERFNNIDLVPSVTVHAVTVSPSSNTKLRVGVCHKTVEGREYCLVVVVRAR